MSKLTKTMVDQFQCREGKPQDFLWCASPHGFGLRCTSSGVKSFIVQGRVNGRERRETIGRYGIFTVDQARKRAEEILRDMRMGVDPKAEKQKRAALSVTLQEIADDYVEHKRTKNGPLRASSKADILRHVKQNFADWKDQPIGSITRDKCLKRFNELTKRSPSQANQAMVILRALCNWARERYATDDDEYPLLAVNPVQRMFKVKRMNPEEARDRRVPLDKIGAVWTMLKKRQAEGRTVDDRTAAAFVAFLLLTGARRGESSTLTWSRVNFEEGWLHFPKTLTKNHNALTLPISPTMRELLETIPRREDNEFVFASWGRKSKHIGDPRGTMDAVSEVAGLHLSPHDLRRTAEDVAKVCKVDADERRQLLNHLSSDVHGKHYANNPDPKTLAGSVESMHAWIEEQARIAEAMASGKNVVELRA